MRQRLWIRFILAILATTAAHVLAAAPPIVCFEDSPLAQWLPLKAVGPYQVRGVFSAKVATAFIAADYQIAFTALPWRRCLEDVGRGQAIAAFAVGWSAERAATMLFPTFSSGEIDTSAALGAVDYYVYVRHDSKVQWNGATFSGIQHGISSPKGYLIEQQLKQLQVWQAVDSDIRTGLELVSKGRLDGIVLDSRVAAPFLEKYSADNKIVPLPIPVQKNPIYLVFSKKFCLQQNAICQQVWASLRQQKPTVSPQPPEPSI